jgi:hypothetical protein
MAKKKTDAALEQPPVQSEAPQPDNAAAGSVSVTNGNGAVEAPTSEAPAPRIPQNGSKRKPDQTFKVWSDKTTILEVAIWENEVRYDDKVSVQHSIVLSRSFKNAEGKWGPSTAYRTHDLPLVSCLLDRAHAWCVSRRTEDSSIPF